MNVKIISTLTAFAYDVAAQLESKGFAPVTVQTADVNAFELRHAPGVPASAVSRVLEALDILQPDTIGSDEAVKEGIEVRLGHSEERGDIEVSIFTDSQGQADHLRALLTGLGYGYAETTIRVLDEDVLLYSDTSAFARQLLRWHLAKKGWPVGEREDSDWEGMLCLVRRDPLLQGKALVERCRVGIRTDDEGAAQKLIERLSPSGFHFGAIAPLSAEEANQLTITLRTGPFTQKRAPVELARLRVAVDDLIAELKIDTSRFPVMVVESDSEMEGQIILPVRACLGGSKRPYAGPYPARFGITIFTDRADAVAGLKDRLNKAGFDQVRVQAGPSILDEAPAGDFVSGFAVRWGAAGNEADIAAAVRAAVRAEKQAVDPEEKYSLRYLPAFAADDARIQIFFPDKGVKDGSLMDRIADPKRYNCKIQTPEPDDWKDLVSELEGWGFQNFATERQDSGNRDILFGGAPPELIAKVRAAVRDKTGLDLTPKKTWGDGDMDIWFFIPRREVKKAAPAEAPQAAVGEWAELDEWAAEEHDGAAVPFVEVGADRVRVGTVKLPRRPMPREPLAPDPADFVHFCIDRLTAATLEHIAVSVALREPCLLEGETSTSKTSSILFLGALLNQPVVRINLNGQTDTGELIGRFVPHNLRLELPLSLADLRAEAEWLEPETRMILERAGNRPLTQVEIQQIMANERMASQPWRWQDGMVVQAMKNGYWVILDEVNLAEPQILERLNSVLEATPMLVLTENDNSVLGPGGTPVHPDFRIFATMNPAEYSGRSVLSPAYRDRWRGYWFTPRPGEPEYLAMLQLLVQGKQPAVTVRGREYVGTEAPAKFSRLSAVAGVDGLLQALSRFQVSLEHAAGQTGEGGARIGARRKERYVFTRRGMLSVMDYLCSPLAVHDGQLSDAAVRRSLLRYYLGRAATSEDRDMIAQLLDAAGIGPNTWSISS